MDKKLACQPVKITKLNSTKSGIAFFNANQGSRIEDTAAIDFKNEFDDGNDFKLINVKGKKNGLFTITGLVKWSEEKRPVTIKGKNGNPSTEKYVRDGIIADDTHRFLSGMRALYQLWKKTLFTNLLMFPWDGT